MTGSRVLGEIYRVVLRRRDGFRALFLVGLGAYRGATVAADGQAFAVRRVSAEPGARCVPRRECEVVLQRRSGVVPTGLGVSLKAPCAANSLAVAGQIIRRTRRIAT